MWGHLCSPRRAQALGRCKACRATGLPCWQCHPKGGEWAHRDGTRCCFGVSSAPLLACPMCTQGMRPFRGVPQAPIAPQHCLAPGEYVGCSQSPSARPQHPKVWFCAIWRRRSCTGMEQRPWWQSSPVPSSPCHHHPRATIIPVPPPPPWHLPAAVPRTASPLPWGAKGWEGASTAPTGAAEPRAAPTCASPRC